MLPPRASEEKANHELTNGDVSGPGRFATSGSRDCDLTHRTSFWSGTIFIYPLLL